MKEENFEKGRFTLNNIDESSSTINYLCKEDGRGRWLFIKIDESSNPSSFHYASKKNNPSYEGYDQAFVDRASLVYGNKSEAV